MRCWLQDGVFRDSLEKERMNLRRLGDTGDDTGRNIEDRDEEEARRRRKRWSLMKS